MPLLAGLAALTGANLLGSARAVEIEFQLPKAANVSAAVYDAQGRLVRELARAVPSGAGAQKLSWDGLDRHGVPQKPGSYSWKVLATPGFEAKYLGVLGTNGEKPYDPWVGNNDGPSAVAWDKSGWYLGSIASETIPTLRKQTPDGNQRLWQVDHTEPWQGPSAMASVGDTLYVLQQNGKVIPMDASTGAHKKYGDAAGKVRPQGWDVLAEGDTRTGSGGATQSAMDMDAAGDTFLVASQKFNLLRWYGTKPLALVGRVADQKFKELSNAQIVRQATVQEPGGVALAADGGAYVISAGAVLYIAAQAQSTPKEFIAAPQLSGPHRLVLDRENGDLLVAETSPGHQIKRFDRNGRLLATFGRKGGRQDGPFVSTDFLNIRDIAATGGKGFLVSEGSSSLRRTSLFDATGKLQGQWFGGSPYYNFASSAAQDPTESWFYSGYGALGVARLNLERGTWDLTASYSLAAHGDGLFPTHSPFNHWRVRRLNGVTYLVHDKSAVLRLDKQQNKLVPFAIAGWIRDKKNPPKTWAAAVAFQQQDAAKLSTAYAWTDSDGDGAFDPEEFSLGGPVAGSGVGHCFIDENWNVIFGNDGATSPWVSLPNLAPPNSTVPRWDWKEAQLSKAQWPAEVKELGGAESRGVWRDSNGNIYQLMAASRAPKTGDRHGVFPGFRNGACRLIKWNAAGELMWNVGGHEHRDAHSGATPGNYYDPARILGIVNNTLMVADRAGWPATGWTLDGLYAGSFLDRRAADGLPAKLYAWWREKRPVAGNPGKFENPQSMDPDTPIPYDILTGGSITALPGGEVLWMPQGENATPLYRVSGWGLEQRMEGKLQLTAPVRHAAAKGTGLSAAYFDDSDGTTLAGNPEHKRVDERIWLGFKFDAGKWLPWSKTPVPGIADRNDSDRNFSVRWTGWLEPQLTDSYRFSAYLGPGDKVRLWLGEELVLEDWAPPTTKGRRNRVTAGSSDEVMGKPVALTAGVKLPLRLEYVSAGPEQASLSLNWESWFQERQRVPTAFLYPE